MPTCIAWYIRVYVYSLGWPRYELATGFLSNTTRDFKIAAVRTECANAFAVAISSASEHKILWTDGIYNECWHYLLLKSWLNILLSPEDCLLVARGFDVSSHLPSWEVVWREGNASYNCDRLGVWQAVVVTPATVGFVAGCAAVVDGKWIDCVLDFRREFGWDVEFILIH